MYKEKAIEKIQKELKAFTDRQHVKEKKCNTYHMPLRRQR